MKIRQLPFNLYLLVSLLCLTACETTEEKKHNKEASTLRLHLESNFDGTERIGRISILRENPIYVAVDRNPFLDEGSIQEASIVDDDMGGFSILLKFDHHGSFVLDSTTTANKGKRIAIFSRFGTVRWLAAPKILGRVATGQFSFTPDATREEAERIVRGLNNVAKKLKKNKDDQF
jgi:preprotein translocase subunit SecD